MVKAFSDRLRELADASEDEFRQYLASGDDKLARSPSHRTSFYVGSRRFCGTFWQGFKWPSHLLSLEPEIAATGGFYWGLWEDVIEAMRRGELQRVTAMRVSPWQVVEERRALMVMPDATAFAWAATQGEATPQLFADLK